MTSLTVYALTLLVAALTLAFVWVTWREFRKMDEDPGAYPVQYMGHRHDLKLAKVPIRNSEKRRLQY